MPDKCQCVDFQTLKLQELHDHVPQGEMPRHVQLYVDRYLCDRVVPGNRVLILGILSIKKVVKAGARPGSKDKALVGIRSSYIRVVGIQVDGENSGSGMFTEIFKILNNVNLIVSFILIHCLYLQALFPLKPLLQLKKKICLGV